jgi:hypothetical protein
VHAVEEDNNLGLHTVHNGKPDKIMADMKKKTDVKNINIKLNTGSAVSVIPEKDFFNKLFPERKPEETSVALMTHSEETSWGSSCCAKMWQNERLPKNDHKCYTMILITLGIIITTK